MEEENSSQDVKDKKEDNKKDKGEITSQEKKKYKLLIKISLENGNISKEEIIFRDKIGRLRDVDINSAGEIFIITDEKDSHIWKLTSK